MIGGQLVGYLKSIAEKLLNSDKAKHVTQNPCGKY